MTKTKYENEKKLLILVFIVISISAIGVHSMESIFPIAPVGFLFLLSYIALTYEFRYRSYTAVILIIVTLATLYRVSVFEYPASLIGTDPDQYALNIHYLMQSGNTEAINFNFYSKISAFLILGAQISFITGLKSAESLVTYPLIIGIIYPLVTAAISYRLTGNYQMSVFASIICSASTTSIWLSYAPIAQSMAAATWAVFFLLLIIYQVAYEKGIVIGLVLILLSSTYTHKLPIFLIFVTIILCVLISITLNERSRSLHLYLGSGLIGILSAFALFLQWTVITDFLIVANNKAFRLFTTESVRLQSSYQPTDIRAKKVHPGTFGMLIRKAHGLLLLPVSGVGWVYVLIKQAYDSNAQVVLSASCTTVLFIFIGVINNSAGAPLRGLIQAEPFLSILTAVIIVSAWNSSDKKWKYIAKILVITILVSQTGVTHIAPDHPSHARLYLASDEVEAKQFGHSFTQSNIHTDRFLAIEETPHEIARGIENRKYQSLGLLRGNVTQQGYEYILYRANVDIYALGGVWKLRYDVETNLNSEYNRIYSNGGASIHSSNI